MTKDWGDQMKMIDQMTAVASGKGKWSLPKGEPQQLDVTWFEDPFWCRILRVQHFGHLCGYVYIPEKHPYFGKMYNTGDDDCTFDAPHGGITCCHPNTMEENPDIAKQSIVKWWRLGFDCMHWNDDPPVKGAKNYKNVKCVKSEILRLHKECEKVWTN